MDVCRGGELKQRVTELGGYSEEDARTMARNVLDAIAYCHKRDFIHRDMKPENILLVEKEEHTNVKIIDFGFAKNMDNSLQHNTTLGTQDYMAPEMINKSLGGYHNGMSPHKVDVWAIGCIVYFVFAGKNPFKGR